VCVCVFVYLSSIHTHLSQYIQLRCHAWGKMICLQTEYLCFYHSCMLYCCVFSFVWQSCLKDQSGNLHDRWSLFLYEVCVCHLCVECNPFVLTRMDTHQPAHKHTNTHAHTYTHATLEYVSTLFLLDLLFCLSLCVCFSGVTNTICQCSARIRYIHTGADKGSGICTN
jgi:hypothetical protein